MSALKLASWVVVLASAGAAAADPTSGVDGALFRSAYDLGGVFSVEGARLMPKHDLSLKILTSYVRAPVELAVPGIGAGAGDTAPDRVLDYVATFDFAFGMTLANRFALGLDVAAYRTRPGAGYGERGRYGAGGTIAVRSTGLVALRPLSNIDPSATAANAKLGDGLAGPLDARLGAKYALVATAHVAVAAVGSVFLPFGEDEMLLGDRNLVFEPKLAFDWRPDRLRATRLVGNLAARFRERTVLEGFDARDPARTAADAKVYLDLGSEAVIGLGGVYEVTPRVFAAADAQLFASLPASLDWGSCRRYGGARCSSLAPADYFAGGKRGDFTMLGTVGATVRISADVSASVMVGAGRGGARGEAFHAALGITWAPQPAGAAAPGGHDRDGDGILDAVDGCPDDPEDLDGFQDEDGCPDPDNDGDGLADAVDRCPVAPEDKDGFEDDDGCPDLDNDDDGIPDAVDRCPGEREDTDGFEDEDGCPEVDNDRDGIPDAVDRCPNDAETVNGVDDDDGCPDAVAHVGPEERGDRVELGGLSIEFVGNGASLTPAARQLVIQVAALIKAHGLAIRVEVHVPQGASASGRALIAQRARDQALARSRANAIVALLVAQGVPAAQLQAIGAGSALPVAGASPTDPRNARVELLKRAPGARP